MSPRFRNTGKVARLVSTAITAILFESPGLQLVHVLDPGASTERFQRVWHIGRTEVEAISCPVALGLIVAGLLIFGVKKIRTSKKRKLLQASPHHLLFGYLTSG